MKFDDAGPALDFRPTCEGEGEHVAFSRRQETHREPVSPEPSLYLSAPASLVLIHVFLVEWHNLT